MKRYRMIRAGLVFALWGLFGQVRAHTLQDSLIVDTLQADSAMIDSSETVSEDAEVLADSLSKAVAYSSLMMDTQLVDSAAIDSSQVIAEGEFQTDSIQAPEIPFEEGEIFGPNTSIAFDPLAYRMQKRYLPQGDTLKFRHFWERFSVGAFLGGQKFVPKSEVETEMGFEVGGFLGFQISRLHSVRGYLSYREFKRVEDNEKLKQSAVGLDYLFNLTSYLYGYKHKRAFSVSPFVGAGLMYTAYQGRKRTDIMAQGGLHIAYHPSRNSEFFVEPFLAVTTDGADYAYHESKYDILYGVRGGIGLNLNTTSPSTKESETHNGNVFFDLSQGATMTYVRGGQPIFQTMGTNYYVGAGIWLTPVFGIRAGGAISDYYWKSEIQRARVVGGRQMTPEYETKLKGALVTGRVEALLNPLMFFKRWRDEFHLIDVNLSLGLEGGAQLKQMGVYAGHMKKRYVGPTFATQVLYNVNRSTSLFVEARGQLPTYEVPYTNSSETKKYTDKVGSVNVGVRVMRPTRAEFALQTKTKFEPYFFVGGQLGGLKQIDAQHVVGDKKFNLLAGLNAGYHFAPLAGVKLQAEYMTLSYNQLTSYDVLVNQRYRRYAAQWRHTYGLFNVKAAYMLNLSNLYQRYDATRKLNLYALAGPMYSTYVYQGSTPYSKETLMQGVDKPQAVVKNITGRGAWALFGGLQADYRLNDHWSLYLEPEAQYYLKDNFVREAAGTRLGKLLVKFSLGTTYRFSDENSPFRKDVSHNRNIFFDVSQGVTMLYSSKMSKMFKSMGTNYHVAAGTWLSPYLGVRVGGSVSDYYWKTEIQPSRYYLGMQVAPEYEMKTKAALFSGRVEALLNPVTLFPRWRETPHWVDVNLSLGLEAGWQLRPKGAPTGGHVKRRYIGPTFGAQVLYNVNPSTSLFVEARGQLPTYRLTYMNSSEKSAYRDELASLNVGVRVMRPTRADLNARDKSSFEPHFFVGGQLGGAKQMLSFRSVGDKKFNLLAGLNGGYHFGPLIGAKFQAEYMMLSRNSQSPYEVMSGSRMLRYVSHWRHTYGLLNLKAAYMLNLTNLYQGYDASRRLNLYALVGPMYSIYVNQNSTFYSKEPLVGGTGEPKALVKDLTGRGAWALFGGMQADYRLNDQWSLYLEPEVQYYLKDKFIGGGPNSRMKDLIIKFSLGTTYRF